MTSFLKTVLFSSALCLLSTTVFANSSPANPLQVTLADPVWQVMLNNHAIAQRTAAITPNEQSFARQLQPLLQQKNYQAIAGLFRQRPHPTDPNKMFFDVYRVVHVPEGKPVPPLPDHEQHKHGERSLGLVLDQDSVNLPHVQKGMNSAAYKGLWISSQERRIRHMHKTLMDYVNGHYANDR